MILSSFVVNNKSVKKSRFRLSLQSEKKLNYLVELRKPKFPLRHQAEAIKAINRLVKLVSN